MLPLGLIIQPLGCIFEDWVGSIVSFQCTEQRGELGSPHGIEAIRKMCERRL